VGFTRPPSRDVATDSDDESAAPSPAPTPEPELQSDPEVEADGRIVFRPGMTMDEVEEQAIRLTLEETGGNRREAAERLGIGERTLYRKIKKYDIEV